MKAAFRAAGVPVAPGDVVHTLAQAKALIADIGYPVLPTCARTGAGLTDLVGSPVDLGREVVRRVRETRS